MTGPLQPQGWWGEQDGTSAAPVLGHKPRDNGNSAAPGGDAGGCRLPLSQDHIPSPRGEATAAGAAPAPCPSPRPHRALATGAGETEVD